jgi:hypothetical protein
MSPAPSELHTPGKSGPVQEAQTIIRDFSDYDITIDEHFRPLALPDNSIGKGKQIMAGPVVELPISSNVLAGLMPTSYENVEMHADLYQQFGATVMYRESSGELDVKLEEGMLRISTENTYVNFGDPGYLHMLASLPLVLPRGSGKVLEEISKRGVLITSGQRYSESCLSLTGKLLDYYGMRVVGPQRKWKPDVLYPVNLDPKLYETWKSQGKRYVPDTLLYILDSLQPVGVTVRPTLASAIAL